MIPLREATDPGLHGGKAVALATLTRAGLPVPDGLVIPADTVAAYARGEHPDLADEVAAWAAPRSPYGVVVRSSASVEDGENASFAGLFTSRFVPTATTHLARTIAEVHASAFSTAVTSYAEARNLPAPDGMAVLIQPALRPIASGVLFPLWGTGWRIEATLGLATLLVAGEITPDVYQEADGLRHDRAGLKHVAALPSTPAEVDVLPGEWVVWPHRNRSKLIFSGTGLIYVRPAAKLADQPVLDHAAVHELRCLGRSAQSVLAREALDIEWAQDEEGVFWLLQARPATSTNMTTSRVGQAASDVLTGESASSGAATGPATLIGHVSQADRMPQGGVLVCGPARPELVPAIIKAAGIACADAGLLCHTAIVARELGKPCVTGLLDAPDVIHDGQIVTVDGDNGLVRLHDAGTPDTDAPTRAHLPVSGTRVVAGPGHQGAVVLAVDHETEPLLDRPEQVNVAGLLYPPGSVVAEPAYELPSGARLRWLCPGNPPSSPLWAGSSEGPQTILHLEER